MEPIIKATMTLQECQSNIELKFLENSGLCSNVMNIYVSAWLVPVA